VSGSAAPVGIGSFACEVGDVEVEAQDLPGFEETWAAESPGADFAKMGCGTFRRLTGPIEEAIAASTARTLAAAGVGGDSVDHAIFATTDAGLGRLAPTLAVGALDAAGLGRAVPAMVSFQQCCSSLTALRQAWDLFADPRVDTVLLVAFDRWPDDRERIRSFALFGDAVTTCLLRRGGDGFGLAASAVGVDPEGLHSRDTFQSRQQVARSTLATVLDAAGRTTDDVVKVFPTNLFAPLAIFNASAARLHRSKLHFASTLATYAHCGNCDWMLNLADHGRVEGFVPGGAYLAQGSAPGFSASALLVARDGEAEA